MLFGQSNNSYNLEVELNSFDKTIDIKEEELEFNCTNLIGAKPLEKEGKGVGMKNTLDQLKILYPDRHNLQTFEKNNNFTVNLKLKLD